MRAGRVLLIVVLLAALVVVPSTVANAATVRVGGTTTEGLGRTCGEVVVTGVIAQVQCEGITATWAGGISGTGVVDEAISVNLVTGRIHVGGAETISNACVALACGTLESTWHGSGWFDLETGEVIVIEAEQHFTGGAGGLEGVEGSIRISLIGNGPTSTYQGFIVL